MKERKRNGPVIYYIRKEKTGSELFYENTISLNHQRLMRSNNKKQR